MKNQKIETNLAALSVVERRVAERLDGQEEPMKEESRKTKPERRTMFNGNTIVQGIMWHEILSDPLCKRRRKK